MDSISSYKESIVVNVANGTGVFNIPLKGAGKFAMIVPAAMNTLTATFQVFDKATNAFVNTGVTQVLATGMWVPSATQLATLGLFDNLRVSLSANVGSDCAVTVFMTF